MVSVNLKVSDNSFGVWPISSAHVKPSNTMLIFMLTDGFIPQSNVCCWQIIRHPLRNVAQHPHGGNSLSCTGVKAPEVIPSCKLSLCHYNYLKTFFYLIASVYLTFLFYQVWGRPFIIKRKAPSVKLLAKHRCYSQALCTVLCLTELHSGIHLWADAELLPIPFSLLVSQPSTKSDIMSTGVFGNH